MSSSPELASAVYTVLLGGYERLNDAQEIGDGSIPFICFTDDRTLTSTVWQIHVIEPLFPLDLQRSQREVKIRGSRVLDQFDRTLYIDNSVSLTAAPGDILDAWLEDCDLALPLHSWRGTVRDEFAAVLQWELDDESRVTEQLLVYEELAPDVLQQRPTWNGMIARRNTSEVQAAMNRWFDEVLRYSRRDQLSANYVFSSAPIALSRVELDNHNSGVHVWAVDVGRKPRLPPPPPPPTLKEKVAARVRRVATVRGRAS